MTEIGWRGEFCPLRFRRYRQAWDFDGRIRGTDGVVDIPDETIAALDAYEQRERVNLFDPTSPVGTPDILLTPSNPTAVVPAAATQQDVTIVLNGFSMGLGVAPGNGGTAFFEINDGVGAYFWTLATRTAAFNIDGFQDPVGFASPFAHAMLMLIFNNVAVVPSRYIVTQSVSGFLPARAYRNEVFFGIDASNGPGHPGWAPNADQTATIDSTLFVNPADNFWTDPAVQFLSPTLSSVEIHFDTLFVP